MISAYVILTFMKENEELKRRVLDLAKRCYQQNIYTFSGFLNAAEISDLYTMERELDLCQWSCTAVRKAVSGRCCGSVRRKLWDMRRSFPSAAW